MVEKRKSKKPTRKEAVTLVNKGYNSLDDAIDKIIGATDDMSLDILVDIFKVAKKVSAAYRAAYIAMIKDR